MKGAIVLLLISSILVGCESEASKNKIRDLQRQVEQLQTALNEQHDKLEELEGTVDEHKDKLEELEGAIGEVYDKLHM